MRRLGILVLIFILFSHFPGYGEQARKKQEKKKEETSEQPFRLHEEIIVTATMTRKMVRNVATSVNVVSREDIEAVAASNTFQLLDPQPGFFISRTGDFGRADPNIRGLGERGRKIAVLIDGRPEKMGLYGCAVTHSFPLDNVERIEVVRGPSSVLYGSDALGGVINVMTRMPEKRFETGLTAAYGSFDTAQLNLKHGGKHKRFSYFLTLDRRQSDGHRENSGYLGNAFTGKARIELSRGLHLDVQGKYFDGRKHEAGTIDVPLMDFWNDYARGSVDLSLRSSGDRDDFLFKLYRNFGRHEFSDGWDSKDHTDGALIRYTNRAIANNELTVGADARIIWGGSYNIPLGEWRKHEAGLFLQDQFVLGTRWILSAGLRLHRYSLFGFELSPHWGVVYHLSDATSLRGSINKGFRSPQLNELYLFPPSNPDLEPERVWNMEVGVDQRLGRRFALSAAVFRMRGSNFIQTVSNPQAPPLFIFKNTGEFVFSGVELGIKGDFGEAFHGRIFYSYLDSGDLTRGRPGHKWDASLRFRKGGLFTSLNAQYVTRYFADDFARARIPSYFLLNARISTHITPVLRLFADLNNLLDESYLIYVDLPGIAAGSYPMPGRSINFGIKADF